VHERIHDAVANADPEAAAHAVEEHLRGTRDILIAQAIERSRA
jgi:DNA-binding GntR family transcriptional regulator